MNDMDSQRIASHSHRNAALFLFVSLAMSLLRVAYWWVGNGKRNA